MEMLMIMALTITVMALIGILKISMVPAMNKRGIRLVRMAINEMYQVRQIINRIKKINKILVARLFI